MTKPKKTIANQARAAVGVLVEHTLKTEFQDLVTAIAEIINGALDELETEIARLENVIGQQTALLAEQATKIEQQARRILHLETKIEEQEAVGVELARRTLALEKTCAQLLAKLP